MQPGGFAKPIPQMARSAVHKSDGPMDKEAIENAWKSVQNMLIQNRCWICEEGFARGKTKKVFMVSHLLKYLEDRMSYLLTYRMTAEALSGNNGGGRGKGGKGEGEGAPTKEPAVPTAGDAKEDADIAGALVSGTTTSAKETSEQDVAALPSSIAPPTIIADDGFAPMRKELLSKNLRNCWYAFRSLNGDKDQIASVLQRVECEVWMSGLICARSKACAEEYLLLVPDGKVSSSIMNQATEELFDADGYSKSRKGDVFRDKNGNICPPGCDCDNPWQYIQAALMQTDNANLTIPGDGEGEEEEGKEDKPYIGERRASDQP